MIDNKIYVPFRRREDELYKFLVFLLNYTDENFKTEMVDVENKYKGPDKISKEAVKQILSEFGLTRIADLLDTSDNIDFNAIAAYAGYLALFKGSRTGYETTLRLLGFDYILQEWWEQSPKGEPNTMLIDVLIDSSVVKKPYETFQLIKQFTAEYVFPVIDPLAYTMSINLSALAFLHHGFAQPIYDCSIEAPVIDEALLYSRSTFILTDEVGDKWSIKINNFGQLKAFRTTIGNITPVFAIERPTAGPAIVSVNSLGEIFAIDSSPAVPLLLEFTIKSRNEATWRFDISDSNIVTTTNI